MPAYEDVADPKVGSTTVLNRVAHAALQSSNLLSRRGTPPPDDAPYVVEYHAAGVIKAVGPDVVDLRPGDRMAGFAFAGSHAELFAAENDHAYPVPDRLDCRSPRRCRSSSVPHNRSRLVIIPQYGTAMQVMKIRLAESECSG